jgi:hypothetical protein
MVSPWLANLSRGGLICPATDFVEHVKSFEHHFIRVHGQDDICKKRNSIQNMFETVCKAFLSLPKEVIFKYARVRTFIRQKCVCGKLKAAQLENYKIKKNAKKIKHFTT